ncbi:hypothetical protein VPHD530_0021 [Vibrio phage D530]
MTIQPCETFKSLLNSRNPELFTKWYRNRLCTPYGARVVEYTNAERDELAICARLARRYTNTGE